MDNWRQSYDAPIFKHVGNLLSIAIVLGFAPTSWTDLHINSIRIFRLTALDHFADVGSIIDGIAMALNYFVESVIASWEAGNLLPFFYEKTMSARLDTMYENIRNKMPAVVTGDFVKNGGCWGELMGEMDLAVRAYTVACTTAPGGSYQRKIFSDRLCLLNKWRFELALGRRAGELVPQPVGIILHGAPGCGKSGLMNALIKIRMAMLNIKYEPALVGSITPDDKYHSQVTNATLVLIFDDVANRPLAYDPSMGIAAALQACNNIPFVANKAEVESKGKVMPDLKMVIGSTNNRHMHIEAISVDPDSVRRRIILVDVVVRSEYRNSVGGIDTAVFEENPKHVWVGNNQLNDVHLFTINTSVKAGYVPKRFEDPSTGETVVLDQLNARDFLYYMELIMAQHDAQQEKHLSRINKATYIMCKECNRVTCRCGKMKDEVEVVSPPDPNYQIHSSSSSSEQGDSSSSSSTDRMLNRVRSRAFGRGHQRGRGRGRGGRPPPRPNPSAMEIIAACGHGTVHDDLPMPERLPPHEEEVEQQSASLVADWIAASFWKSARKATIERLGEFPFIGTWLGRLLGWEKAIDSVVSTLVDHISTEDFLQWWYWLPDNLWDTGFVRRLAPVLQDVKLCRRIKLAHTYGARGLFLFGLGLLQRCCFSGSYHMMLITTGFTMWFWASGYSLLLRQSAYQTLSDRRTAISDVAEAHRDKYNPYIKALLEVIGLGFIAGTAAIMIRSLYVSNSTPSESLELPSPVDFTASLPEKELRVPQDFSPIEHQNFMGLSEEELIAKNNTKDVWMNTVVEKYMSVDNRTMTDSQLHGLCKKNLSMLFVKPKEDWIFFSDIFWFQTDCALIPAHAVPRDTTFWKIMDNTSPSSSKIVVVGPENCVLCGNQSDMAFVYVSFRSKRNLIPYFNVNPVAVRAKFFHKDEMGLIADRPEMDGIVTADVNNNIVLDWKWPTPTYVGLCGGVYCSLGANPTILGVHFGGRKVDLNRGVSYLPSHRQIEAFLKIVMAKPHTLLSASHPEEWNPPVNGYPSFAVADDEPNGYMTDQVEWLKQHDPETYVTNQGAVFMGERGTKAFYKSSVRPTIIAQDIALLAPPGLEFDKPKFGRSMWPKSAAFAFQTSPGLPQQHLEWAVQDYLSAFRNLPKYLLKDLKPLSWDEVLNGISGLRHIDAINWNSSMGINFSGGKKNWITTYISDLGEERKQFLKEVWDQVDIQLVKLKAGMRVPWLFMGCPKDEPTLVTKDKVRLYMVGEICCTLIIRKYYTPVFRVLQMCTSASECAVGINCLSPDWEELMQHLERFQRAFDGDHSKYDLRKSPDISGASYRIMIEIASLGSYTAEDLVVMQFIPACVLRPLVSYNGYVYALDGSTPSGIPATVNVNSLDNSLMNRCAFYSIYPNSKVGDFRTYVSHANYGDDFINTVSFWRRNFNFITLQKYLATYGLKITPGIKDAAAKPFVPLKDLVFLQRYSAVVHGLPFRVGKLHEASIWKSLLSVLHSKSLSPEEAAAVNVDGALREWAFYGREHYEKRREQMKGILSKHCIIHLSKEITIDHSTMIAKTSERYV
jgi:hypothetical protein